MIAPGSSEHPLKARKSLNSKSEGCVGNLQSCSLARHVVVDEKSRTVGDNARKYNFCRTKRLDYPATCPRSTVPSALCRDLSAETAAHKYSLVHKHELLDVR